MEKQLYKVAAPGSKERLQKLIQYWRLSVIPEAEVTDDDLEILIITIMTHFNRED